MEDGRIFAGGALDSAEFGEGFIHRFFDEGFGINFGKVAIQDDVISGFDFAVLRMKADYLKWSRS